MKKFKKMNLQFRGDIYNRPIEIPYPKKEPEIVPAREPLPNFPPEKAPEITPGKEPLTQPGKEPLTQPAKEPGSGTYPAT